MEIIIFFVSLISAVIPMMFYLLIIWWMDRNEREPFGAVLLSFVWGATGAIVLAIIGSLIFQIPVSRAIEIIGGTQSTVDLSGAVITAPLVEETTKGIFLLLFALRKQFDGVVDGVVYGGAVGLGFGMTENFMYFLSYSSDPSTWIMVIIIRTLFSAVMHCMSQATFGAFIGFAKFKSIILKLLLIPAGLAMAMFLHFMWNLTVSFQDTSLLGMAFMLLYGFSLLAIFQIALYFESKTIMRELTEESKEGVIPAEHLNYLPYVSRRLKSGWSPQGVNQKEYVKTAITLALRRHQFKNSKGSTQQGYKYEIETLRYKIQMMFYNANLQYQNRQN